MTDRIVRRGRAPGSRHATTRRRWRWSAPLWGVAVLASLMVPALASPDVASAQVVETATWTEQEPASSPAGRYGAGMATDPAGGNVIVFGGWDGSGALADTWSWNGAEWVDITLPLAPPPRYWSNLAAHPPSGGVVLFGGSRSNGARTNETWAFVGGTWVELDPATKPPVRRHALMDYHPGTGMVLLGGQSASGTLGDMWVFDGVNWSQRFPSTLPPARSHTTMALDPVGGELVLFGGFNSGSGNLGDTWVWDGTTWSQRTPSDAPSPRRGHRMAFDPVRDQVVLFGGYDGNTLFDDTWAWDGQTWAELQPAQNPPERAHAGMALHPASGGPVLFGGVGCSGVCDDTWTLGTAVNPDELLDELPDPSDLLQPPVDYRSDDCDLGSNVVSGHVDGVYMKVRETPDPLDPGGTWVCVAADDGTTHVGGKLVVSGGLPGVPADTDDQADACQANANNEEVDSGFVAGEPYRLDVAPLPAGSSDALWVCASWGSVGVRLVFTTAAGTATRFEPDLTEPHPFVPPDVWPVVGEPSADCRLGSAGQQTRVVNLTVGDDSRLALTTRQESTTRAHVCFRAEDGTTTEGGRFTLDANGGAGVSPVNDLDPCPFPILTGTNPINRGVHTSDPEEGAPPASVCVEVGSLVTGVTVTGDQGVVSFQGDTM